MASARRPRTSGRRSSRANEGIADRDDDGGSRQQRKLKLSDMLGPVWTEEDLKSFYQAYRKHGRDWKKVSSILQNRTAEMVEALYNMNKAYLSLPEGAASVAGLIAMMTDHFNILEESKSNGNGSSEELTGSDPSQPLPIHTCKKLCSTVSVAESRSGVLKVASGLPSYGGPSPAKKPRSAPANRPRIVGKRTPHVLIDQPLSKKASRKATLNKRHEYLEQDSFGDCDRNAVETAIALTLAAASQRAASPQVSCTPGVKTEKKKHATVQNGDFKETGLETESGDSGPRITESNDGGIEGSQESREVENTAMAKRSISVIMDESKITDINCFPLGEEKFEPTRGQKLHAKKVKADGGEFARLEDLKEECSCTEEGTGKQEAGKGADLDVGAVNGMKQGPLQRKRRPPAQRAKKRSRQLFSGDESSGLDALATLADLSLNGMLPSPRLESEATGKPVDDGKAFLLVDASMEEHSERDVKEFNQMQKRPQIIDVKCAAITVSELYSRNDSLVVERDKQRAISELKKKKRRAIIGKLDTCGESAFVDPEGNSNTEIDPLHLEDVNARGKLKRVGHHQNCRRTARLSKPTDTSSEYARNWLRGETEVEQNVTARDASIPARIRSRRKTGIEKVSEPVISFSSVNSECDRTHSCLLEPKKRELEQCCHLSADLGSSSIKARLMHCLSSAKVRRWSTYEWFYSAIDLPWFSQNEFVEYLNHAGLGHVPRLTRVEWAVIRSSLGKPRRLSKRFLQEERQKLELYRESVRKHYHEVRVGHREGLPTDFPRPLTVGQRVIAHHPKTREIHDGSILTVDRNRCRVQFDRPELGVEFVADIDAMPVNALDNLSELLIRRNIVLDGVDRNYDDLKCDLKLKSATSAGSVARAALNERLDRPGNLPSFATPTRYILSEICKQAHAADTIDSVMQVKEVANEAVAAAQLSMINQPCTLAQVQAREADIRALADLMRALDKKEALLVELRNMNDEATATHKDGELVCNSESFRKQYATVLLQLKEVNEQVRGALCHLRQRNKYQENVVPPWHRLSMPANLISGNCCGVESNISNTIDQPPIGDLKDGAMQQARLMVTTAIQAMSSLTTGEEMLSKIAAALKALPTASFLLPTMTDSGGSNKVIGAQLHNSAPTFGTESVSIEESATVVIASTNGKEIPLLNELIASCVAVLLMVQAFTERQFATADISLALDSILRNLQPRAPQNHLIFKEIEQYTSLLKDQIVALVPTQAKPSLIPDCQPI